ncbi:MAG: tRNA pseudouridine(55) synthase TruB [Clostridia bacterium]|nr:tRNA pseudouridine(55) synthase TruB [Clostridia bacterium]
MSDRILSGLLLIDKEKGMTSHDVVSRVRKLMGTRQVGHTGTLDPMAEGVLPVLVGRAVKASEYLTGKDKTYTAVLLLGVRTDTQDVTGKILETSDKIPPETEVLSAIRAMEGPFLQTPPMFSALKVGGVKLYRLARQGIEIEREPVEVVIRSIRGEKLSEREYRLTMTVSKGTYVRTVCEEIGKRLGCGGTMKELRRDACGSLTLQDCRKLSEVEACPPEERGDLLRPLEECFEDIPAVSLIPFFERLFLSGCAIDLKKIGLSDETGPLVRIVSDGEMVALGKIEETEEGNCLKMEKLFSLEILEKYSSKESEN